jgi:hypothetical protein
VWERALRAIAAKGRSYSAIARKARSHRGDRGQGPLQHVDYGWMGR